MVVLLLFNAVPVPATNSDQAPEVRLTEQERAFPEFSSVYLTMSIVVVTREDAPFVSGLNDLHGCKGGPHQAGDDRYVAGTGQNQG